MAKKKNRRSQSTENKSSRSGSSSERGDEGQELMDKFDDMKDTVRETVGGAVDRIPPRVFYFGLGALALGAAAVVAYVYRERIGEVYDDVVESFENQDDDTDMATSGSRRKLDLDGDLAQVDPH
jgi:hypothetical protein